MRVAAVIVYAIGLLFFFDALGIPSAYSVFVLATLSDIRVS
jgi:hypothetical protein